MAINEVTISRFRERKLYFMAAILFPLIIFAGFARTFYLKGFFDVPPLPSLLVQLHGIIMTGWVCLFVAQVWLVRSRNVKLHMKLGIAGVTLAILIVIAGSLTAISAATKGVAVPGISPLSFLLISLADMLIFPVLFAAAVYYRKRAANHKRLMLLNAVIFLPPAVGRIPIASLTNLGPIFFFGVPTVFTLIALVYDTWTNRKLNKVFLAGSLLLIASYPLRLLISGTDAWMRFAGWLTSFAVT